MIRVKRNCWKEKLRIDKTQLLLFWKSQKKYLQISKGTMILLNQNGDKLLQITIWLHSDIYNHYLHIVYFRTLSMTHFVLKQSVIFSIFNEKCYNFTVLLCFHFIFYLLHDYFTTCVTWQYYHVLITCMCLTYFGLIMNNMLIGYQIKINNYNKFGIKQKYSFYTYICRYFNAHLLYQ